MMCADVILVIPVRLTLPSSLFFEKTFSRSILSLQFLTPKFHPKLDVNWMLQRKTNERREIKALTKNHKKERYSANEKFNST
jgi:hypothetical protein